MSAATRPRRRRPLRRPAAVGAAAVLRAGDVRREPILSALVDGRLAIEPRTIPAVLTIRWFGTRYTLRVPGRRPFTAARDAAGARDRRRAGGPLPRDLNPQVSPSAASCSAARSRIATSARSLDDSPYGASQAATARRSHRLGHRGPAGGRAQSATRTGRSRPACCCSAHMRTPSRRIRRGRLAATTTRRR